MHITIDFPKNYLPPTLPARPLDKSLRVALVLPTFQPTTSATFGTAVSWKNGVWGGLDYANVAEYDNIVINFAEATSGVLPRIVRRLFPRTEILRATDSRSGFDLVLIAGVDSRIRMNRDLMWPRGADVFGTLEVSDEHGNALSTITAVGTSEFKKRLYWSSRTRSRAVGIPALQEMLDQLVRNILEDEPLKTHLWAVATQRARPSDLELTARFDDSLAFFPNGRLDAGETARLLFTVHNRGGGPGFGVQLKISSAAVAVSFPAATEIGELPPGARKELSVAIAAGLDVETALPTLRVDTTEKRGYGGRPVIVKLATERLNPPHLEIADFRLSDHGGRAQGDADGRPSNGETLEAVVLIRNSGPGDAVGAGVMISSPTAGVEIVEQNVAVPRIPAHSVKEARTLVRLPVTFSGAELPLTVHAVETRGSTVAQTSKTRTWEVQNNRPSLEVRHRLYDGGSPGSRGDRDGVANNGETVELALTPVNRGALAARDVWISVASRQTGVAVNPQKIRVGDLPADSEGAEQRVRLEIPRVLGRDTAPANLPLTVAITQRDFSSPEQQIALPFRARRPELVADVIAASPLTEGQAAVFALDVRNQGSLPAEKVRLELSSENDGVELLDDSGAPARKLQLEVGVVGAAASATRLSFKAHIRRNVAGSGVSLKIVASQSDFPSAEHQTTLPIQREQAAVISAVPPPALERTHARTAAIPAVVSFHGHENGSHLQQESVVLKFEVQSHAPVETIRLEQNRRSVEAGPAMLIQDQGSYAWQYKPQVQLEYGENVFEVIVVSAEGHRGSRRLSLHRRHEGKVWVAVVGISSYANPDIPDLLFAKDDASAILAYYRGLGIPEEQLIYLLDEQATLASIKRTLGTDLVSKTRNPDDTVILYFAGHGERESDAGSVDADGYSKYLLPHDANPSDLFGSALSMEELTRILQRLSPERVALIVDSCFSGAAGGRSPYDPNVSRRAPVTDEFLSRMASAGRGRVILTASSGHEAAQEWVHLKHGVFTHFLLEGLEGDADVDRDAHIDVDEIYRFVSQKVSAATNGRQNPVRKAPNLTGTVILGKRLRP